MKILSEEELAAKLDFRSPLHPPQEETESVWCIPFEYGGNPKGTRISIAKAKEIAAELRASVAEAEFRQLRKAFEDEKQRGEQLERQCTKALGDKFDLERQVAILKKRRRSK